MPDIAPTASPAKLPLTAKLAIVAIAIGYILNPMNGALVITAYPHLASVFDVPYAEMSAMVMFFMAATAMAQPLAGGIGDRFGRKNTFIVGIIGFGVASFCAGFSTTLNDLLLWRVAQAIFSGVIVANALGLISQVVPAAQTGRYLGLLNSVLVGTTTLSFPLGGLLVKTFDWHLLFWINIPFAVAALVLALFCIPKDKPGVARFTSLSFIGVPFVPFAMGLQAYLQGEPVWFYVLALVLSVGAVVYGISRSASSRAQLASINNRYFNYACLVSFFSTAIQFGNIFVLPAWVLVTLGVDSSMLGVYLSISAIANFIISPIAGRMLDQRGPARLLLIIVLAFFTGISLMIVWPAKSTLVVAVLAMGVGVAVSTLVSQRTALLSSPKSSHALAMGIFSSARAIGGLSGNALAAIVLSGYITVTAEAGVAALEHLLAFFLIPLVLSAWGLRKFRQ